MLLKDALQDLQLRMDESRQEKRSPKSRLQHKPRNGGGVSVEGVSRERKTAERGGAVEDQVMQKIQFLKSSLEQEVKDLKVKLAKADEEKTRDAALIEELQAQIELGGHVTQGAALVEDMTQERARMSQKYEEAQEEIRMLQEALRGTVSVEAAAKDFEEMKAEMGAVIGGLQKRLKELSKSYSDSKNELSNVRGKLQALESADRQEDVLKDMEQKYQSALKEVARLEEEVSLSVSEHTQVVASLGNTVKTLETELDSLRLQLRQKDTQVGDLHAELKVTREKVTPPDSLISVREHARVKEALESEVTRLSRLLQDALRKQEELKLELTAARGEVKNVKAGREEAQKEVRLKEQERKVLSGRWEEAQKEISQLKERLENHVIADRDKNKKVRRGLEGILCFSPSDAQTTEVKLRCFHDNRKPK